MVIKKPLPPTVGCLKTFFIKELISGSISSGSVNPLLSLLNFLIVCGVFPKIVSKEISIG
jgi:hypothetical protein